MSIHLRLELTELNEIQEWEQVKAYLGTKSNTDALRVLIRRVAQESGVSA